MPQTPDSVITLISLITTSEFLGRFRPLDSQGDELIFVRRIKKIEIFQICQMKIFLPINRPEGHMC